MKNKKLILTVWTFVFVGSIAFAQNSFDASLGFRFDPRFYNYIEDKQGFELGTSAYFSSSVNFTNNFMLRTELSFSLYNLATKNIFTEQNAYFWVDDISLIYRIQSAKLSNYLSVFMGLNEPLGSDIFLERHFGISNIASKITEGWLGMRNGAVFSPYGLGVADTIRFGEQPMAIGLNLFLTREEANNVFAMNANIRYAMAYRFFTLDFLAGAGLPIKANENLGIKEFDRIYLRGGATVFIGNNYTPSLLIQAGITNLPLKFDSNEKFTFDEKSLYLIVEPRINIGNANMRLSMFNLSQNTDKNYSMFLRDTFGFNFLFFHDSVRIATKRFTFGGNLTASFPEKNIIDIFKNGMKLDTGMTCVFSPYMETELFTGELRVMLQVEPIKIENSGQDKITVEANRPEKMFRLNIGYKVRL